VWGGVRGRLERGLGGSGLGVRMVVGEWDEEQEQANTNSKT
jgi:hypothetical protein